VTDDGVVFVAAFTTWTFAHACWISRSILNRKN